MAAFPNALATFAGFVAGHTLKVDNHAAQHNLEQAEILAVQTKVGTNDSTPVQNTVLRGIGTGISDWEQVDLASDVTGTLPVAHGGTGGTNLTFPAGPDTLVGRATTDTLTNKTLTTPTIGSFTNAQHDHTNAAGGGLLGAATVGGTNLATNAITLGYAEIASGNFATTTTGSDVDVTNLAVTVNVPTGGRYVRITAFCPQLFKSGSAGDVVQWSIKEGATVLQNNQINIPGSNFSMLMNSIYVNGSVTPGSHTFKIAVQQATAGTITVTGSSTAKSFILVEVI